MMEVKSLGWAMAGFVLLGACGGDDGVDFGGTAGTSTQASGGSTGSSGGAAGKSGSTTGTGGASAGSSGVGSGGSVGGAGRGGASGAAGAAGSATSDAAGESGNDAAREAGNDAPQDAGSEAAQDGGTARDAVTEAAVEAGCPDVFGTYSVTGAVGTCGNLNSSAPQGIRGTTVFCALHFVSVVDGGIGAVNGGADLRSNGTFAGATLFLGTTQRQPCNGTWVQGSETMTVACGGVGDLCTVTMQRTGP